MSNVTNASLAWRLAGAGSVVYNGTTYTRAEDLPSDAQIAADAGINPAAPYLPPPTVLAKTANFTAAPGSIYLVDCSGGSVVATLPAAAVTTGPPLTIQRVDGSANTVTVRVTGTDDLSGLGQSSWHIGDHAGVTLVSNGADTWWLIGGGGATVGGGLRASSEHGHGLEGDTTNGSGVYGAADSGYGIEAFSNTGIAIEANSNSGAALQLYPFMNFYEVAASAVPNADSGTMNFYVDSADHHLKRKDHSGTVVDLG